MTGLATWTSTGNERLLVIERGRWPCRSTGAWEGEGERGFFLFSLRLIVTSSPGSPILFSMNRIYDAVYDPIPMRERILARQLFLEIVLVITISFPHALRNFDTWNYRNYIGFKLRLKTTFVADMCYEVVITSLAESRCRDKLGTRTSIMNCVLAFIRDIRNLRIGYLFFF